ncbi:Topoisomerase 1-associated factor 1 [Penicillium oxalicum]|uniref:Topoisomerase 1-associated factor 1 n=1 Tax=Penicillium oxalicum TaxID=69781 RepID=UPI0020B66459|nr:Topoisomerase 1-associated factor 1 [Penicillium oxalicum]KAI2792183.1 Topoisomerase 1-associated factor 1 [Penicillium oxalicum]
MELEVSSVGQDVQVIDPDVRMHVYSLVTALGGFNGEDADRYMLGDDALSCLRDIRRWLRLYDQRHNRMDVVRCLGEANLVMGDLLPILSIWWNNGQNSKHLTRVALACLELLVPLTWPAEYHSQMTANHHRHTPYIQQAQVQYKRGILRYGGSNLIRAVIRVALPSMAIPRSERESRDEGILKLMLYLLRNIAIITTNERLAAEGDEEETSRSATINAFQDQDAFALILTMCSNVADDFNQQDVVLLEILFHIIKGVNVDKLFLNDEERKAKRSDELSQLLKKENQVKREYARNAPTRHGRFGTMIWVKRDEHKVSTVSGQNILRNDQASLQKMDESKKWKRPARTRRNKDDSVQYNDFNTPVYLSLLATKNLRTFVEEFLDSGFNPLFTHVRKAIEREAERVTAINARQFFYTVGWFLEAERARRARQVVQRERDGKSAKDVEPDSFGLVAGVLNQETFISLNRSMQNSLDNKEWDDLTAQMRCFTQILLTVQEMTFSPLEEDQEIADNIQNRIFYEETTHDRVLSIVRGYKDQGFGYLDAATELSHVFLRMLERYSKTNVDLQIRSKRRAKKRKKAENAATERPEEGDGEAENDEEINSEDEEDLIDSAQVSKERAFDFKRFAAKFCNQSCVNTFVEFISFYRELNSEQLKRAHRYFYRIAFKQEMTTLLFRLDIISLFHRMIKGPGAMDSSKQIFKEWEELVRQILRRLTKRIDQRPALITELLFSKMNSTIYYLEFGHERQSMSTAKRPPAELHFISKETLSKEAKQGVVAGALVLDGQADLVKWLVDVLKSAASEREDWETNEEVRREEDPASVDTPNPLIHVKPGDEFIENSMFSNPKLRLLMESVGFERLGQEDVRGAQWVVPANITCGELHESISAINKAILNPMLEGSDEDPRQLLRRKETSSARASLAPGTLDVNFGDDSEGEDVVPDGPLFPPNLRTKSNALDELKQKRKKKSRKNQDDEMEAEPLDDALLEERRQARLAAALARQNKIKSDLFIHASDDETDEEADREFFRMEENRRREQAINVTKAMMLGDALQKDAEKNGASHTKKPSARKRKNDSTATQPKRRRKSLSDSDEDDDILMADPDEMSPDSAPEDLPARDTSLTSAEDEMNFDDDLVFSRDRAAKAAALVIDAGSDDEDTPVAPSNRRTRGGFVIDSDSD